MLGAEIKLTQCCLDGHHCCEFQAADRTTAESSQELSDSLVGERLQGAFGMIRVESRGGALHCTASPG